MEQTTDPTTGQPVTPTEEDPVQKAKEKTTSWAAGAFQLTDFDEKLGLKPGGEGGLGKSNSILGDDYLSSGDVDRLKSNKDLEKAYIDLHGEDAADEHRNEDGDFELGEGSLDALLDTLAAEGKTDEVTEDAPEDPPIELSKTVQDAKARTERWIEGESSGRHADEIFGASNDLAKGIRKGDVGTTNPTAKSTQAWSDKYKLDLTDSIKKKVNAKTYQASVATPQNTDQDNQEGF